MNKVVKALSSTQDTSGGMNTEECLSRQNDLNLLWASMSLSRKNELTGAGDGFVYSMSLVMRTSFLLTTCFKEVMRPLPK